MITLVACKKSSEFFNCNYIGIWTYWTSLTLFQWLEECGILLWLEEYDILLWWSLVNRVYCQILQKDRKGKVRGETPSEDNMKNKWKKTHYFGNLYHKQKRGQQQNKHKKILTCQWSALVRRFSGECWSVGQPWEWAGGTKWKKALMYKENRQSLEGSWLMCEKTAKLTHS